MLENKIKVTYLTQTVAPYRERMHELMHIKKNLKYSVIYCAKLEPNREWNLDLGNYNKYFLVEKSKGYSHNNPSVWKLLNKLNPDVLIITGFSPTMDYGVIWTILKKKKLVVYNDGTFESEKKFSKIQKMIRKFVFKRADAFAAPGRGTFDLYESYGVPKEKIFRSCLCVNNTKFTDKPIEEREYDLLFAGQIIQRKMPIFFVEVAKKIKTHIPELKVLIIGDGVQRNQMLNQLEEAGVMFEFKGFLDQDSLPEMYSNTKLFLFPTLHDPWGVVANEACASGTPVITTPVAGAANDLVQHNVNGYVLQPEIDLWTDHIVKILQNKKKLTKFSKQAIHIVKRYNHQQAADGLYKAIYLANS